MKKLVTILLALAMALTIVACSSPSGPNVIGTLTPAPTVVTGQIEDAAAPPANVEPSDEATTFPTTPENVPEDTLEDVPVEYCEWGSHTYGEAIIEPDPNYFDLYYKKEICSTCGFMFVTAWGLYIPEGATEIPAPGGEKDLILWVEYCSDGSHVIDGTAD